MSDYPTLRASKSARESGVNEAPYKRDGRFKGLLFSSLYA